MRVAPLFVFADGERERGVEHGVHHVDEGDVADDGAEEVGAQVGDRAHEQAAGAAAFDDDAVRVACSRCAMRCSAAAMKSVKVLRFCMHAAGVVPGLAQCRRRRGCGR